MPRRPSASREDPQAGSSVAVARRLGIMLSSWFYRVTPVSILKFLDMKAGTAVRARTEACRIGGIKDRISNFAASIL